MKTTLFVLLIVAATAVGVSAFQYAPQQAIPETKPLEFSNPAVLDSLIMPYVAMARRTYPDAKARFLKGLSSSEKFLITTRVFDKQGNFQQIFVEVTSFSKNEVNGRVASSNGQTPGLAVGDPFTCPESDVLDWSIVKADGSQEGNVVGKFLAAVQERFLGLMMEVVIARDGSVKSAKCLRALTRSQQDVTFCVPDTVMRSAEVMAHEIKYAPSDSVLTKYTYLVYDFIGRRLFEPNKDQTKKPDSTGTSR